MIETILQDIRFALRMMLKNPSFTVIAILALALGIGANSAIFSVVNAVLLRQLPFENPKQLVMMWGEDRREGLNRRVFSTGEFDLYKKQQQAFTQIAAMDTESYNLAGGDQPERVQGARVSADLFPLLGVKMFSGRALLANEETQGSDRVAVLNHGFWQRRFGSDPNLINQSIILNGESYTVVGILPPEFELPRVDADVWVPLSVSPQQVTFENNSFYVIGRLKPGLTPKRAQASLNSIARQIEQDHPESNTGIGVYLVPLNQEAVGDIRPALLILLSAVSFVLLIACANVANLLLARATARRREIAVRIALGASRRRLIRQLVTESLLLSLIGGGLGLLLALWGKQLLASRIPEFITRVKEITIDYRVLGFTLLISLLTGIIFGLIPALQASRPDLNEALKDGGQSLGGGARRNRIGEILVVTEVALALVLLIGAGLMIRSFMRLQQVDPGFDPRNVLTMRLTLPASKYQANQQGAFYRQVMERVKALPGVQYVAVTNSLPLSGLDDETNFMIEGRTVASAAEVPVVSFRMVSPDYFRAMGISVRKGRYFDEPDIKNARIIINETMARRFWPDEEPLEKRIKLGGPEEPGPWLPVVGVVGDVKQFGLRGKDRATIYITLLEQPSVSLVVRTAVPPLNLAPAIRNEVLAVDKDQPVYNIRAMEQVVQRSFTQPRLIANLLAVFAALSLMLAAVGIYGVMSYYVSQRTHEIGIRMALGAQPQDVLKMVLRQGLRLTLIGVGVGLLTALALARVISSLLYGVSFIDPPTYLIFPLLLGGVALLASYIPAHRATKVDPLLAIRYE
ncbi:MAG: ABC transporter permease [Pyrinomonadaceae bacterium]